MKKISLLLVASICVTLLGCGKTENAEATAVSGISIEPIENISESETLTETDTTDNHFTEALDDEGTYWLSGYLRASDKDSAGQPDEYGVLQAIIYDTSIEEGVYTVSLDMDTLPITVAPQTNDIISRYVKIEGGQVTKLEIPLMSTVGSVSGTLKISDDFHRDLKISDFIVVILDENGDEVNYSTVGESGDYYISGLAPGKYTIQLDEKFINTYGLEELPKSSIQIVIPNDYNNPIDLIDQNLEYRASAL